MPSSKEKGDLLEEIIEELCVGIKNVKVSRNLKIIGKKTKEEREIDVYIEGKQGVFDIKIAIESKNYGEPVGVEKVESFKAKLEDIAADLGVMVCPTGFTEPAKKRAEFDGIQLFEVYDERLGNSKWFIPIRFIEPELTKHRFTFKGRGGGPFSISIDSQKWRFHIEGKILTTEEFTTYLWNKGKIPQKAGEHKIDHGAVVISEEGNPDKVQYCEIEVDVVVEERYFLKLIPASFLKKTSENKQNFQIKLDLYSKEKDMLNNGWRKFLTLEEMNQAADIENQPEGIRGLILHPKYTYEYAKKHELRLHPRPFEKIRSGKQIIESRLNDEKRQQIKVGDHLVFALRPDFVEKEEVEVVELIHAPTFRDLFLSRPLTEFGIEDGNIERVENMYEYYSKEDEAKYGVVGIKFKKHG